jgi:hypothetical protein
MAALCCAAQTTPIRHGIHTKLSFKIVERLISKPRNMVRRLRGALQCRCLTAARASSVTHTRGASPAQPPHLVGGHFGTDHSVLQDYLLSLGGLLLDDPGRVSAPVAVSQPARSTMSARCRRATSPKVLLQRMRCNDVFSFFKLHQEAII